MAIKATVETIEVKNKPEFPRIMCNKDQDAQFVVYFTSETTGFVLFDDDPTGLNLTGKMDKDFISCYDEVHWKPCSITLTDMGG